MENMSIQRKLQQLKLPPAFSQSVTAALLLLSRQDISISEIKTILDPRTTAEVLKVANSVYYRRGTEIISLEHAISVIGLTQLAEILLTVPVLSVLPASTSFDSMGFLKSCIITGRTASLIATETRSESIPAMYTAGILHDIGILAICLQLPGEWAEINRLVAEGVNRPAAERQVIGFDHGYIGGLLLTPYNLPASVVYPITYHNHPSRSPSYEEEARIIQAAELIAEIFPDPQELSPDTFLSQYESTREFLQRIFPATIWEQPLFVQKLFNELTGCAFCLRASPLFQADLSSDQQSFLSCAG